MIDQPTVREALRTLYTAAPEAASVVESHVDELEQQVLLLSNDDAFRAYLLSRAQQDGAVQTLMQRLDSTLLAPLAQAEAVRAQAELVVAEARTQRQLTVGQVLSQPVVLAVVGILSTLMTGLVTALLHFVKAGG